MLRGVVKDSTTASAISPASLNIRGWRAARAIGTGRLTGRSSAKPVAGAALRSDVVGARTARIVATYSRMKSTGATGGIPSQVSLNRALDTPNPIRNRPPDQSPSIAAVIAAAAGWRSRALATAVPTSMVVVAESAACAITTASEADSAR